MTRVSPVTGEVLVRALVTKLETYSTAGSVISRETFNRLLNEWILTSSPNVAYATQYPDLALKIFTPYDRRYRNKIQFLQSGESSPFRFGLALTNLAKGTVAKDIDITINICWQDGVVPRYAPVFEVPAGTGWEYYRDKITYWDEAVLRFRGFERDRCPSGQPLEWILSLVLRERLSGEFLLRYQVSSVPMREPTSGRLKIHMG